MSFSELAPTTAVLPRTQFQRGQQGRRWSDTAQRDGHCAAQAQAFEVGTEGGLLECSAHHQGRTQRQDAAVLRAWTQLKVQRFILQADLAFAHDEGVGGIEGQRA